MALAEEVVQEYRTSLKDLNVNSKPLINMLTMLADDNEQHAPFIVEVIEDHITKVDEKTRASMYKLRQTWVEVLPSQQLYKVDVQIHNFLDPAWPITAQAPEQTSIHVNPKFLAKAASSSDSERSSPEIPMEEEEEVEEVEEEEPADDETADDLEDQETLLRKQLIAKQQELLRIKQASLELELAEAEEQMRQRKKQAAKTSTAAPVATKASTKHQLSPKASAPAVDPVVPAAPPRDPRLAATAAASRDPRLAKASVAPPVPPTATSNPLVSQSLSSPFSMPHSTVNSPYPGFGPAVGSPPFMPAMGLYNGLQVQPPGMAFSAPTEMPIPAGAHFDMFTGEVYNSPDNGARFSDDSESSRSSWQEVPMVPQQAKKMNNRDPRAQPNVQEDQKNNRSAWHGRGHHSDRNKPPVSESSKPHHAHAPKHHTEGRHHSDAYKHLDSARSHHSSVAKYPDNKVQRRAISAKDPKRDSKERERNLKDKERRSKERDSVSPRQASSHTSTHSKSNSQHTSHSQHHSNSQKLKESKSNENVRDSKENIKHKSIPEKRKLGDSSSGSSRVASSKSNSSLKSSSKTDLVEKSSSNSNNNKSRDVNSVSKSPRKSSSNSNQQKNEKDKFKDIKKSKIDDVKKRDSRTSQKDNVTKPSVEKKPGKSKSETRVSAAEVKTEKPQVKTEKAQEKEKARLPVKKERIQVKEERMDTDESAPSGEQLAPETPPDKGEKRSSENEATPRVTKKLKIEIPAANDNNNSTREVPVKVERSDSASSVPTDISELFGSEDQDYRSVDQKGLPMKSPSSKGWDTFKAQHADEFAHDIQLKKQREEMELKKRDEEPQDTDYRVPPSQRRPSSSSDDGSLSKVLDHQHEILLAAHKQLQDGKITRDQHQEIIRELGHLMHIQKTMTELSSPEAETKSTKNKSTDSAIPGTSSEQSNTSARGDEQRRTRASVSPDKPLERFKIPRRREAREGSPCKAGADARGELQNLYPDPPGQKQGPGPRGRPDQEQRGDMRERRAPARGLDRGEPMEAEWKPVSPDKAKRGQTEDPAWRGPPGPEFDRRGPLREPPSRDPREGGWRGDMNRRESPGDFERRGPEEMTRGRGRGRGRPGEEFHRQGPPEEFDRRGPPGKFDRMGPPADIERRGPPVEHDNFGPPEEFDGRGAPPQMGPRPEAGRPGRMQRDSRRPEGGEDWNAARHPGERGPPPPELLPEGHPDWRPPGHHERGPPPLDNVPEGHPDRRRPGHHERGPPQLDMLPEGHPDRRLPFHHERGPPPESLPEGHPDWRPPGHHERGPPHPDMLPEGHPDRRPPFHHERGPPPPEALPEGHPDRMRPIQHKRGPPHPESLPEGHPDRRRPLQHERGPPPEDLPEGHPDWRPPHHQGPHPEQRPGPGPPPRDMGEEGQWVGSPRDDLPHPDGQPPWAVNPPPGPPIRPGSALGSDNSQHNSPLAEFPDRSPPQEGGEGQAEEDAEAPVDPNTGLPPWEPIKKKTGKKQRGKDKVGMKMPVQGQLPGYRRKQPLLETPAGPPGRGPPPDMEPPPFPEGLPPQPGGPHMVIREHSPPVPMMGPDGPVLMGPDGPIQVGPDGPIHMGPDGPIHMGPDGPIHMGPDGPIHMGPDGPIHMGPDGPMPMGPNGPIRMGPDGPIHMGPDGPIHGPPDDPHAVQEGRHVIMERHPRPEDRPDFEMKKERQEGRTHTEHLPAFLGPANPKPRMPVDNEDQDLPPVGQTPGGPRQEGPGHPGPRGPRPGPPGPPRQPLLRPRPGGPPGGPRPLMSIDVPHVPRARGPSPAQVEAYFDLNGDARYRSFVNMSPEVSEEVVLGKKNYEIKLGAPPRRIQWGSEFIEVYADPSKRGVIVNGTLMYKFGERVKEVQIRGRKEKIFYHGKPLNLWIEGQHYEVRVDSPPKAIFIDSKPHRIQIDGRDMMILIDKEEKGQFGGSPRFMFIDGDRKEVRFDPPPRHILIDQKLCELKLNMAQPCVNIEGKLHGIRFDGPPRDVFINGVLYQIFTDHAVKLRVSNKLYYVSLGGPCHELIADGKWFEVKFNEQPKEITLGNTVLFVQLPGPPPEVKILPELPPPMQPMPMPGPPPMVMQPPPMPGMGPMMIPISAGMRPPPPLGMPMQMVPASTVQMGLPPPSMPLPVPSQPGGLPSSLSSLFPGGPPGQPPPNSGPAPMDINSLLQKLVSTGILPKDKKPATSTAAAVNRSQPGAKTTDAKAEIQEPGLPLEFASIKRKNQEDKFDEVADMTEMDVSRMKALPTGIIQRMYAGVQCTSCGARFRLDSEERADKYKQHLDWHFRQNRRDKEDTRVVRCRKWYYGIMDWLQYEDITDTEEIGKSNLFEAQVVAPDSKPDTQPHLALRAYPEGSTVCPPATGNDNDDLCDICHEPFEQYWEEEHEQWHLRDAIRVNNKTYHPICYEDYTDISEGTPSPSVLNVTEPSFSAMKTNYDESSQDGLPHSSFEEERGEIKSEPTSTSTSHTELGGGNVVVKLESKFTEESMDVEKEVATPADPVPAASYTAVTVKQEPVVETEGAVKVTVKESVSEVEPDVKVEPVLNVELSSKETEPVKETYSEMETSQPMETSKPMETSVEVELSHSHAIETSASAPLSASTEADSGVKAEVAREDSSNMEVDEANMVVEPLSQFPLIQENSFKETGILPGLDIPAEPEQENEEPPIKTELDSQPSAMEIEKPETQDEEELEEEEEEEAEEEEGEEEEEEVEEEEEEEEDGEEEVEEEEEEEEEEEKVADTTESAQTVDQMPPVAVPPVKVKEDPTTVETCVEAVVKAESHQVSGEYTQHSITTTSPIKVETGLLPLGGDVEPPAAAPVSVSPVYRPLTALARVKLALPSDVSEISQEVLEIGSNASTPTRDELPSPPSEEC